MISDIANLIAAAESAVPHVSRPSVVRIETTRPVFLVFSADSSKPDYVIHVSPAAEAQRIHGALAALHPIVGDLVPEPVAVRPGAGDQYLQIERGVAGLPWFTMAERFRRAADRLALRGRAIDALGRLQRAIASIPGWRRPVCPAAELKRQFEACQQRGIGLSPSIRRRVEQATAELLPLSDLTWPWQHGDFCLNNLLIHSASIGIIDFQEFATTAVPLHDEFGLALSVHDLVPIAGRSLGDDVRQCVNAALAAHPELRGCTEALFLHHLLWRINSCDPPNRHGIRRQLIGQLEQACAGEEQER